MTLYPPAVVTGGAAPETITAFRNPENGLAALISFSSPFRLKGFPQELNSKIDNDSVIFVIVFTTSLSVKFEYYFSIVLN